MKRNENKSGEGWAAMVATFLLSAVVVAIISLSSLTLTGLTLMSPVGLAFVGTLAFGLIVLPAAAAMNS